MGLHGSPQRLEERMKKELNWTLANEFGHKLKCVLELLGMSQSDLAKRSGLTQAAISQIISGSREPQLSSIVKILRAIPVKLERLVSI